MPQKTILFSGSSAVGKTSVLRTLLPYMREKGESPMVCKIDCLMTEDAALYQSMGIPAVSGISRDICPDHFLVSNLPELWDYADRQNCSLLFIETAGLCHRCSPATVHSIAGWTARPAAALPGSWVPCCFRRILSSQPKPIWYPRLNWRSYTGT